jgi:hypothetical protein
MFRNTSDSGTRSLGAPLLLHDEDYTHFGGDVSASLLISLQAKASRHADEVGVCAGEFGAPSVGDLSHELHLLSLWQ